MTIGSAHNEDECKKQLYMFIESLIISEYYGKVEISFENGVPLVAKETKSIKFGLNK